MTKRNLERLFMLQSLIGFTQATENQPIVSQIPAFVAGTTTVQNLIDQITAISGPQSQSIAGGGTQKEYYRNQLNQITFTIINVVKGYALSVNNFDLAKQLSASLTTITRTSDKLIAQNAQNWSNIIEPLIPNLSPWGITQVSLDSLATAITNYNNYYQLPITKLNTRKQLTQQVSALITQGVAVCKSTLDTSINSFIELGYPDFVQMYHYYRKLRPTATVHTKLRLFVLNQLGHPVTTGEVYIIGTDSSANLDINGYALVDKIPFGTHNFTLTTPSGTNNYGPFLFKKGHSLTLHVQISTTSSAKPKVTITEDVLTETATAKATTKK